MSTAIAELETPEDVLGLHRARRERSSRPLDDFDAYEPPVGEVKDLNKFVYAANDPVNGSDPTGQFTLIELLSVRTITLVLLGALALGVPAYLGYKLYIAAGGEKLTMRAGSTRIDMQTDRRFGVAFTYMKQYAKAARKPVFNDCADEFARLIQSSNPLVFGNDQFSTRGQTEQAPNIPPELRKTFISTHPDLNAADIAMIMYGEYQRRHGILGEDVRPLNADGSNFQNWLNRYGKPPPTKQWDHPDVQ